MLSFLLFNSQIVVERMAKNYMMYWGTFEYITHIRAWSFTFTFQNYYLYMFIQVIRYN